MQGQDADDVLLETSSLGRNIVLRRHAWTRVVARHREMRGRLDAVAEAIEAADLVFRDAGRRHREHFYMRLERHRGWLRVIVDFGERPAIVIHAQTIRHLPRHLEQL